VGKSVSGVAICGTSCGSVGVNGRSSSLYGVAGISNTQHGVDGRSVTSAGVFGYSCCGVGIVAINAGATTPGVCIQAQGSGIGIVAQANNPLIGKFKNFGYSSDKTALVQFETADTSPVDWMAGVAGKCNVCKVPDGSFYVGQTSKPRLVVSTSGDVGIGTTKPKTSLQVNGSLAVRVVSTSASYTMKATDYAVLASGSGTAVTLPSAKTAAGMIVFIKNVNTTSIAVTVKAAGSDKIDGLSSLPLNNAYSHVTLISDGVSNWYVQSS
jgi:hypothetical protein